MKQTSQLTVNESTYAAKAAITITIRLWFDFD